MVDVGGKVRKVAGREEGRREGGREVGRGRRLCFPFRSGQVNGHGRPLLSCSRHRASALTSWKMYFTHPRIPPTSASLPPPLPPSPLYQAISLREAKARCRVVFPRQTMGSVLHFEGRKELMSAKGPVFSTAIGTCLPSFPPSFPPSFFILTLLTPSFPPSLFSYPPVAGVMGAKKTSELIPFCHPLSLEDCHIDIRFDEDMYRPNEVGREGGSVRDSPLDSFVVCLLTPLHALANPPPLPPSLPQVLIDCTVRVQGKTGVEMEAMSGASIAALCIYDMCKATSHDILIKVRHRPPSLPLPPSLPPSFFPFPNPHHRALPPSLPPFLPRTCNSFPRPEVNAI